MKYALAALALALLPAPSLSQSVKVPAKVEGPSYRLLSMVVESDGKDTKWVATDGLDVFREYDPDPSKIRLRLIAYQDGLYKIHFVTSKGDRLSDFVTTAVIIGKDPGPGPGPGPGPKPPEPKPTPEPSDPLFVKLKVPWLAEADPKKAEHKKSLTEVWEAASKAATDPAFKTYGDWLSAVKNVSAKMLPATALQGVRRAIGDYLNAAVTTDGGATMTPDLRALTRVESERVAAMLSALK